MSTLALSADEARRRRPGYVALVAVQFFFGLFPLFGKQAFQHFSPRAVGAWRILFGAGVLALLAFAIYGRRAWPDGRDWARLVACALLGIVLNMFLFLEGLERSTAVNTALLLPLIPVFTAIVAIALRAERFDRGRALGMGLAFLGASVVLLQRGPDTSRSYLLGNSLVILNEICYAVYLVIARPLLSRYPPLVVITWVFVLSLWAVPLFLAGDAELSPGAASARSWSSIAYIVVFPTVLAYLLNVFALSRVSASTTAAFIFIQPLITIVGGLVWLGESLPANFLLATALTFGGVWIVARRPAVKPLEPLLAEAGAAQSRARE